jgi:hypothetical protein
MKPFFFGSNRAKKIAKSQDVRDRKIVLLKFGALALAEGRRVPKKAIHHAELVQQRHAQYDPSQGGA